MDIKDVAPMRALRRIKTIFPTVFDKIDQIVEDRDKETRDLWDHSIVYGPVALAKAAMEADSGEEDIVQQSPLDLALITALAGWRKAKTVYDFAPELAQEIVRSAQRQDMTMPMDALALPYWSVYIRPNIEEWDIDGFFVYYDEDVDGDGKHYREIRFTPIDRNGRPRVTLYLITGAGDADISIKDCLGNNFNTLKELDIPRNVEAAGLPMEFPVDQLHNDMEKLGDLAAQFLSFVLYLAAVNADVRRDERHPFKRTKKVRDIPREVEYLHVGEQAAVHIRSLRSGGGSGEALGGHHRPPDMHIRRAHWHTFRIGKGRKLTRIKWLAPILVNADGEEPAAVTVRKIKNSRKN